VFIGVLLIIGGHTVAYLLLRPVVREMVYREGRVIAGAAVVAGVALLIYFLAGVFVARMSPTHTVREPAVAAVLALLIVSVIQFFFGMINAVGLVLGAPLCFGVTYLGGVIGERWQQATSHTRRVG
jgi:hypothetical protein